MGAERIIAMSRHPSRQKLAREFGATDIVTERGEEGIARIKEITKGLGADSVLECVGTQESMLQVIRSTRPGGYLSHVRVPHEVKLDGTELFFGEVHLHGGPAPVRRYLPNLIDLVLNQKINPGKVFDLVLPLNEAAEGYRAMHERRAIKTLLSHDLSRALRLSNGPNRPMCGLRRDIVCRKCRFRNPAQWKKEPVIQTTSDSPGIEPRR